MISKKTVLILGAGASSHLHYPIGSQLVDQIVSLNGAEIFKDIYPVNRIKEFQLHLSRYGCISIDEFLEKNRDFVDIGKGFIGYCLNKYEVENNLFPPHNPGWYQYLFSKMLTSSADQFADNKLTIITFNYDRSLEVYLHNTIKYRFNLSDSESLSILKQLNIIHPHGILGEYPEIPYSQCLGGGIYSEKELELLNKITSSIKIIHEISDVENTFSSLEFELCHKALEDAEKIYFLGFGFHEDNIRRFRFFSSDTLRGKEVYSTCKGFTELMEKNDLMRRLSKYGFIDSLIAHVGTDCVYFFKRKGILE